MDSLTLAALSFYFPKMTSQEFYSLIKHPEQRTQLIGDGEIFQRARKDLEVLSQIEAKVTYLGADDYPQQFLRSLYPPVILTYWGEPVWLKSKMISIVGGREPTERALVWMDRHLPRLVEDLSLVTVSGGARGVDQKAHLISLRLERPTVVFLPSGLLKVYPRELTKWLRTIIDQGGAIVSEFRPHQAMFKSHFFRRNRLIASLSELLLVVEAKRTGGSMMTAQWALEQGKTVCTIPGYPDDPFCAGNNQLLLDGASLVRDTQDLSELVAKV